MEQKYIELQKIATKIRKNAIRAVAAAGSGHPGGSLSAADILTVLYFDEMNINLNNPTWEDRDRFVLSKGHATPGLYGTLSERGYFEEALLDSFRQVDSILQGHPALGKIPGVDMSTGSLGQGLSAANGMALAAKLDNKQYRVYAILGDGELQEGQVWEAAMTAAHYQLDNVCIFIDFNGLQIDGDIETVMNPCPIDDKFKAFGWNVININGHDYSQIIDALAMAKKTKGKPTAIIAKTVKGKGVSFMENDYAWHGTAPNAEQTKKANEELDQLLQKLEG